MEKQVANVVFLGAAGAGKSTLAGHLLHLVHPHSSSIEKYGKEAAEKGMAERKFAWVVNRIPEERANGHTINVSYHCLETEKVSFTLFDVPGKRKYAGNLIAGISCADIAVLVVSAQRGEFEAAMGRFGQTQEHILLAYALGLQLKVVINKLDCCNPTWAEDRYAEIKTELSRCLGKVGYQAKDAGFVAISAWHGFNLIENCADLEWYRGPSLLQVLTHSDFPKPDYDQPLRLSILEVYRIPGIGTVAVGKVHSGAMSHNSSISFLPLNHSTSILSLERHHQVLNQAKPGAFIAFVPRYTSSRVIYRGLVVVKSNSGPFPAYPLLTAQLLVLFTPGNLQPGYQAVLHCHTAKTPCRVEAITAQVDRESGTVGKERPSSGHTGDTLICILSLKKPIYVEEYGKCPALGRFVLRDMGVIVAVGVIKEIERGK